MLKLWVAEKLPKLPGGEPGQEADYAGVFFVSVSGPEVCPVGAEEHGLVVPEEEMPHLVPQGDDEVQGVLVRVVEDEGPPPIEKKGR